MTIQNEIYLSKAVARLRPNAEFVIRGNDYATIEWHVLEGIAPTLAEVKAEIAKIVAERA
jgi:hypothetical protein